MIEDALTKPKNGMNNQDLVEMLKDLGARCRTCAPVNPLECVTRCNLWKLKNELRQLRDTMDDPNFIKELFNVLKNSTRLQILKTIVRGRHSMSHLQEELKKAGYSHSCDTISEEYLQPLMQVGLAAEAQEQYYATTFGGRLTEVLEEFSETSTHAPSPEPEGNTAADSHRRPHAGMQIPPCTTDRQTHRDRSKRCLV